MKFGSSVSQIIFNYPNKQRDSDPIPIYLASQKCAFVLILGYVVSLSLSSLAKFRET